MPSNYSIIRELLKRSQFSYDERQIEATEHYMKLLFESQRPTPYQATLEDFCEYISIMYPDHVLYYKCYSHPNISDVILYLIIERLQNKDLDASRRQIHALCYHAEERLKSGAVADETHAANSVIKLFQTGEWHEPYDFEHEFPEYKKKLKEVHPNGKEDNNE